MVSYVYLVKCLTNLHVGSGEASFKVIDNEVEKDPVNGLPIINSSGVKGAFRQYYDENEMEKLIEIFGSDTNIEKDGDSEAVKKDKQKSSTPGSLKFLSANLLARPVRASAGSEAFYMVTTKTALKRYFDIIAGLGLNPSFGLDDLNKIESKKSYKTCSEKIGAEGYDILEEFPEGKLKNFIKSLIGSKTIVMSEEIFKEIDLPVIARNRLDNGISKNLWYEEYVPHESLFYCAVLGSDRALLDSFDKAIEKQTIQFGGNETIGCGLCMIKKAEV